MNNTGKTMLGILAGAAAGATLGLLFAPKKGKDTRKAIADTGKDYYDKFSSKADEIKSSIEGKLDELKCKTQSSNDNSTQKRIEEVEKEIENINTH